MAGGAFSSVVGQEEGPGGGKFPTSTKVQICFGEYLSH